MSKSRKVEQKQLNEGQFDAIAIKFTKWIGSSSSIICHTIFFIFCFSITFFGVAFERMLLFLTTVVSLEAIYLAILIQLTVNRNTADLVEVGKELDEIQEDVGEIQEDIDEMQEDVEEIQEDIDEIQDDVDEIEEGDTEEEKRDKEIKQTVEGIQIALEKLMREIGSIKKNPTQK